MVLAETLTTCEVAAVKVCDKIPDLDFTPLPETAYYSDFQYTFQGDLVVVDDSLVVHPAPDEKSAVQAALAKVAPIKSPTVSERTQWMSEETAMLIAAKNDLFRHKK